MQTPQIYSFKILMILLPKIIKVWTRKRQTLLVRQATTFAFVASTKEIPFHTRLKIYQILIWASQNYLFWNWLLAVLLLLFHYTHARVFVLLTCTVFVYLVVKNTKTKIVNAFANISEFRTRLLSRSPDG